MFYFPGQGYWTLAAPTLLQAAAKKKRKARGGRERGTKNRKERKWEEPQSGGRLTLQVKSLP